MTGELETIRRLYRWNARVRDQYRRVIWSLPERERYRDRGASYPSLVDIYLHIVDAYRWWFVSVYAGRSFDEYPIGIRMTAAEAKRADRAAQRAVDRVLARLRPSDLGRTVTKPSGDRVNLRNMLLHMFEEELQHRGELNALLWQMDIDPPVTGLDDYPRVVAPARRARRGRSVRRTRAR